MIELVSGALVGLWWMCITLRGLAGDMRQWVTGPHALTSCRPVGREYRLITTRPRGRIFALQVRLVIA
jgi:hypothetical protein